MVPATHPGQGTGEGRKEQGQWIVPPGNNFVAISGGDSHCLAISTSPLAPIVTSITPNTGEDDVPPQIVTIVGNYFQAGAAVKLTRADQSDIEAAGVTVMSSTKITCRIASAGKAKGGWHVVVTNPDGQSANLPNAFTVTPTSGVTLGVTF